MLVGREKLFVNVLAFGLTPNLRMYLDFINVDLQRSFGTARSWEKKIVNDVSGALGDKLDENWGCVSWKLEIISFILLEFLVWEFWECERFCSKKIGQIIHSSIYSLIYQKIYPFSICIIYEWKMNFGHRFFELFILFISLLISLFIHVFTSLSKSLLIFLFIIP